MNLRLNDTEEDNILAEKEYLGKTLLYDEGITESITNLEQYFGNGFYKEISFEGVHIGFGNTTLRKTIRIDFESDFETIEMHFALSGKSSSITNKFDKGISFLPHQHNIIYANGVCGSMLWECAHFQLCEINLTPAFFKKFFPQGSHLFDRFRDLIEKGNSGLISNSHNLINGKMYEVVYEIMSCQRQGIFKRMYLEAKVIELLLLQLEQFSDPSFQNSTIKKSEADKIYAVREYILQNLDSACSLIDLAHKVGTNEFILKKGFKEMFGTTVFSFWNDAKMEQAKHLLTEQRMNVGEVSQLVGYKNQRHFSAAFKKKFGIIPSLLLKK